MNYETIQLSVGARDITGQTFGRLKVIAPIGRKNGGINWLCFCECGTECEVVLGHLINGRSKSCGCLSRELARDRLITHGMSDTPLYMVWVNMNRRCRDSNATDYEFYGGRGIKVCERWRSFENFYADMGELPKGKTIDRINNDSDYTPENCKWSTHKQQARNRRSNLVLTHNGKTMCATDWAEKVGMKPCTLYTRLHSGWPVDRALTEAVRVL